MEKSNEQIINEVADYLYNLLYNKLVEYTKSVNFDNEQQDNILESPVGVNESRNYFKNVKNSIKSLDDFKNFIKFKNSINKSDFEKSIEKVQEGLRNREIIEQKEQDFVEKLLNILQQNYYIISDKIMNEDDSISLIKKGEITISNLSIAFAFDHVGKGLKLDFSFYKSMIDTLYNIIGEEEINKLEIKENPFSSYSKEELISLFIDKNIEVFNILNQKLINSEISCSILESDELINFIGISYGLWFRNLEITLKDVNLCYDEKVFISRWFEYLKLDINLDLSDLSSQIFLQNLKFNICIISFKPLNSRLYSDEIKHSNPSEFMSKIIYIIKKQVLQNKNTLFTFSGAGDNSKRKGKTTDTTPRINLYGRLIKNFIKPENIFKTDGNTLYFFKESLQKNKKLQEINLINVDKSQLKKVNFKIVKMNEFTYDVLNDINEDKDSLEVLKQQLLQVNKGIKEQDILFTIFNKNDGKKYFFIQLDEKFKQGYKIFVVNFSLDIIRYSNMIRSLKSNNNLDDKIKSSLQSFIKKLLPDKIQKSFKIESYKYKKYKRIFL